MLIGGTVPAAANIIAASGKNGIETFGNGPSLTIQGNFIGTDLTGSVNLGNASDGIYLFSGPTVIGGMAAGAANVIAFNGAAHPTPQPGINVLSTPTTILSNDIYSNADLGINNNNVFDKRAAASRLDVGRFGSDNGGPGHAVGCAECDVHHPVLRQQRPRRRRHRGRPGVPRLDHCPYRRHGPRELQPVAALSLARRCADHGNHHGRGRRHLRVLRAIHGHGERQPAFRPRDRR